MMYKSDQSDVLVTSVTVFEIVLCLYVCRFKEQAGKNEQEESKRHQQAKWFTFQPQQDSRGNCTVSFLILHYKTSL